MRRIVCTQTLPPTLEGEEAISDSSSAQDKTIQTSLKKEIMKIKKPRQNTTESMT